jgi:hypothetical protein
MNKASWWTVDTIFTLSMGVLLAVVMTVAPFVRGHGISGDAISRFQVLDQALEYEQICQTTTPEERKALKSGRRC